MEIRCITKSDDRTDISKVYGESWKYTYKGIVPQDYLDDIPKGQWASHIEQADRKNLWVLEEKMLERAESFCDDERVEFLQSDVRELPYKEMFNIVTAIQVNHYLKKDERIVALKKYYDALKENGIYISFENFAPDSEEGTRLYLKRWKEFQIANGKTREEAESHIKRYGQSYFPISISESIKLLKDCGFRVVEVLWVSYMQAGILARK